MNGSRMLVVRHRQSTWNADRRWAGQADPPLSPTGEREAELLRDALAGIRFDAVVSSDLRRARDTAQVVVDSVPPVELLTDPRLRELDAAAWSGCTREEITRRWPGTLARWRSGDLLDLPGAEPWAHFERRVLAALHGWADHGASTLVVAHFGVLRVLETALDSPYGKQGRSRGVWLAVRGRALVVDGLQSLSVTVPISGE